MIRGRRWGPRHRGTAPPRRTNRAVVYLVVFSAVGCLVLSLFILHALEIRSLRRQLQDLRAAQQQALLEQSALRERLAEKDDPEAIEEEARARLGWVMRGEEKVIFIGEEGE